MANDTVLAAHGLGKLHTFLVGALPVVSEVEPNSNFAQPQQIAMNTTVAGVAANLGAGKLQIVAHDSHERGDSKPRDETQEECNPREVEGAHRWSREIQQQDACGSAVGS